jgi:hypothetical protein
MGLLTKFYELLTERLLETVMASKTRVSSRSYETILSIFQACFRWSRRIKCLKRQRLELNAAR